MKSHIWLSLLVLTSSMAQASYTVAVKDFREIFAALVAETGISATDTDVDTFYSQIENKLPATGSVEQVTAPGLLAFTGLSALFCQKLVTADAALADGKRRANNGVDFTQGPAAFTAAVQAKVFDAYTGLFWSRSPSTAEFTELTSLVTDVTANLGTTPADTANLLTVACTAVAGSLDGLVN